MGIDEITLLVPSKGSFPSTVVGQFLGKKVSDALCKGDNVSITSTLRMNLQTARKFEQYRQYGMLFGVYLSKGDCQTLDSATSVRGIALLPWTEKEGKDWQSIWNPAVLGAIAWTPVPTPLHPDVEAALLQLTGRVNLSSGLKHPLDKQAAKETFAKLKLSSHILDADVIRQWATRNGWQPKDAQELGDLSRR